MGNIIYFTDYVSSHFRNFLSSLYCSTRWSSTRMPIKYNQTRTVEQRLTAAKDFIRDVNCQMSTVIDDPLENLFEQLYAPWPVRIFVVDEHQRLTYKAQLSETMLEIHELNKHPQLIVAKG